MNYDRYTKDLEKSALLNGNATSVGGNGVPDARYKCVGQPRGKTIKANGLTRGCVTTGPFKESVSTIILSTLTVLVSNAGHHSGKRLTPDFREEATFSFPSCSA